MKTYLVERTEAGTNTVEADYFITNERGDLCFYEGTEYKNTFTSSFRGGRWEYVKEIVRES